MDEPGIESFHRERKNLSRMGFGLLLLQLLTILLAGIFGVVYQLSLPGAEMGSWATYLISLLPEYLVGVPVCWLVLRPCPVSLPEKRTVQGGELAMWFCMTMPLLLLGSTLGDALSGLVSAITGNAVENTIDALITGSELLPTVLFAVLIGSCVEELIFRKVLLDRLRRYGDRTAVILSGLLFGLVHGNLYQFFYTAAVGCLFAYVYCRTGRVRYTIFLHICVNAFGSLFPLALQAWCGDFLAIAEGGLSIEGALEAIRGMGYGELAGMLGQMLVVLAYETVLLGGSAMGLILLLSRWRQRVFLPGEVTVLRSQRFRTFVLNPGCMLMLALYLGIMVVNAMGI